MAAECVAYWGGIGTSRSCSSGRQPFQNAQSRQKMIVCRSFLPCNKSNLDVEGVRNESLKGGELA